MKKYTFTTDRPSSRLNRRKLTDSISETMRQLDERSLLKLYAFAHRMRRDKVK